MATNCGSCGGARRDERRTQPDERREYIDPTRQPFTASANPKFLVRRNGVTEGKRFSTLEAAQDYARKTGGVIRQI